MTEPAVIALPRASSNGWWGMVLLIATEATLFAVLLASYFYVRFETVGGAWPPGDTHDPALLRAGLMTAVLAASSVFMHAGESGVRKNSRAALVAGLGIGFVLGLAFLALQVWETDVVAHDLTPRTNAYGSLFFTITGAHAAHLVAGLVLVAWIQARAWAGAYTPRRHLGVQVAAIYWHFVVVLQVTIFAALYLSPRI